jgi:hypothetical protein
VRLLVQVQVQEQRLEPGLARVQSQLAPERLSLLLRRARYRRVGWRRQGQYPLRSENQRQVREQFCSPVEKFGRGLNWLQGRAQVLALQQRQQQGRQVSLVV